jgi:tRNA A-37 threonylcarbamoyl transferase component Bud32
VLEFCPRDGTALPASANAKDAAVDPILDTTIDGRYAIESRLGEGGMGVVYKARHVLIDKPVAIKILRKEAAQDTAAVQRFIQEAKSASKINHSNIVDITDFGVLADGHAYFVMEFLQGLTLAQAIQDGGPLEPARVCIIAAQVARGLHAAHQKGIVHRDLKPENIFLLEREGQKDYVKIVDFGIAKVGGGQKLTQVGMVLGTPEYMSPEQATGQETDHRVDQYALGCIMYEMLTGVVPFLGERPAQTLTKHVFEPVISPKKRKPDLKIPASVDAVVMRTLAKKPEQRFPSMRELEQALTKIDSDSKGGRVVIDDAGLASAPNPSGAHAQTPIPSGSQYPPPAPPSGYPNAPQQGYYPPSGPISAPGQAVPQAMPSGFPGSGPYMAPGQPMGPGMGQGMGPNMGQLRPTREGQQIKVARGRAIFVATAAALVLVIALLIYFVSNSNPPAKPVTPPPKDPTQIDTPKNVDTTPNKPPPPVIELSPVEVNVVSNPPAAEVYIDGNLASKTPYKFKAKRGVLVRVEVRKRGFDPYYEELEPDAERTINVKLDKAGRGTPVKPGLKKPPPGPGPGPVPSKNPPVKPGPTTSPGGNKDIPSGLRNPFGKK